ncbi:tetratricopeptide repeat protein [Asaia bogorensis]|uniref:Uncharacterized protein n=1 Tax=Asaia bogorensis NBRC 16594 TaxID=1231624 RepID=A0AAN4U1E6_9PROT|nr:tetratricopeptide repeat protein [Asaia bogorensis]BAT20204.1 tetratricopeptide repeat domain protein [Asaia bogorensis NBRC 16594]GBQ80132.1 hypothetical protein AA0311_2248 [Asaia bogorensis NBRC 16594]GEL52376.1 hypothetical protein ABO01nite_03830 [Asaia bogorensis NBRC 16594]
MRGARVSRFLILSTVAAATGLGLSSAQAQVTSREGIALQNQIQQLSQQLQQVQSSASSVPVSGNAAPAVSSGNGDLVSQLLQRVSTLENENREMRGELDQLTNQVQTQNATLTKQIGDMQFAAQNGAGGAAAGAASSAGAVTAPATSTAPPAAPADKPATALDLLKSGQAALKSRDYATAQSNAEQALKLAKTANGKLESQFLLAQSLAGQKQYRDSAVAYYDAYNRSPKSTRAQEALLGVSASMLAMGDKNSACQALQKLDSEFPSPTPRVKAAVTSFKGRANCH